VEQFWRRPVVAVVVAVLKQELPQVLEVQVVRMDLTESVQAVRLEHLEALTALLSMQEAINQPVAAAAGDF
jgi:hypothetical protein